ncbi:MAG: TetR/AcrR family transcriptional regulator [Lachnospiraceae bacterium]|nr:TetR/AcrR family transcriptional regulator [Lachnospiraceae bacterium]
MARKESITREIISEGAFKLLREQGETMLTARKLASYIGCSTQPIFRVYEGMEELSAEMFQKARNYYENFCMNYEKKSNVPFVDLALCYIQFAAAEPNLFKLLFLAAHDDENTMYDLINGKESGFVIKELRRIPNLDMNNAGMIFMKVFVFMHGMACMVTNGEFDLEDNETTDMLVNVISSFIS